MHVRGGERRVVGAAELRRPEDHIALAGTVRRIGTGAPTIRSSMPSPLTSPAPATEPPL